MRDLEHCKQCGTSMQQHGDLILCPACDARVIVSMRPPGRLFSDDEARAIVAASVDLARSPLQRGPRWTLTPPVKPGIYWRCDSSPMVPDIVLVWNNGDPEGLRAQFLGVENDGPTFAKHLGGLWWTVPIDPPSKPHPDYWHTKGGALDRKDPP